MKPAVLIVLFGCVCSAGKAQAVSPLFSRGYTVMLEPQKVLLADHDISIGQSWRVKIDKSVPADDAAVETLLNDFARRFHVRLNQSGESSSVISLRIVPGSVQIGQAQDSDRSALEKQAYRMTLRSGSIAITANAPAGLFYGVETLVQLAQPAHGELYNNPGFDFDWWDEDDFYGPNYYGYSTTRMVHSRVGTLVLDMYNATTKRQVWRSTSANWLNHSPQRNTRHLRQAIDRMLSNFPPRAIYLMV
jgi:hypothetical protein